MVIWSLGHLEFFSTCATDGVTHNIRGYRAALQTKISCQQLLKRIDFGCTHQTVVDRQHRAAKQILQTYGDTNRRQSLVP